MAGQGESEVPIWIVSGLVIVAIVGYMLYGTISIINARHQAKHIRSLEAQVASAPLVAKDDVSALPAVFKSAGKAGPESVYYRLADGAEQPKSDVDALNAKDKKAVMGYIVRQQGKLIKQQCYQVNSTDGSWNAGWCSYEVLKDYSKKKGLTG
jgi:hypothetical protein